MIYNLICSKSKQDSRKQILEYTCVGIQAVEAHWDLWEGSWQIENCCGIAEHSTYNSADAQKALLQNDTILAIVCYQQTVA